MKKKLALLLAALLLLTGCQPGGEPSEPVNTTVAPEATTEAEEETTMPVLPTINPGFETEPRDSITFENPGKVRLTYTGNRSFVKYVTSVEELPNEEALKDYDEAFFETRALVIIVETVNSGSVQLEIGGIYLDGDTAGVSLKRSMPGQVGTADMATWLLWAEVSRELDYNWTLEGGSSLPAGEKY